MPKQAKNGEGTYTGKEPSPKGLGFNARNEGIGKTKRGKDGNMWKVQADKNGVGHWKLRSGRVKSNNKNNSTTTTTRTTRSNRRGNTTTTTTTTDQFQPIDDYSNYFNQQQSNLSYEVNADESISSVCSMDVEETEGLLEVKEEQHGSNGFIESVDFEMNEDNFKEFLNIHYDAFIELLETDLLTNFAVPIGVQMEEDETKPDPFASS